MGPRISRRAGARVRALAASIHSSLLFQSLPLLGKKKPVLVPWEAGVPGICQGESPQAGFWDPTMGISGP